MPGVNARSQQYLACIAQAFTYPEHTMTRIFSLPTLSLLLVLTGGALPMIAPAAAWQLIESRGRAQTELDLTSVVPKDGRATGWVQHTYSKLTSSESGAYFAYRSMKEQLRMHCGERSGQSCGRTRNQSRAGSANTRACRHAARQHTLSGQNCGAHPSR